MPTLTGKEKAVYDYISETIKREGFAPSVRDISAALNIKSTSTVHGFLKRLEEKGYIRKQDGKSRTLHLADSGDPTPVKVPLIGQIRAGMPNLAVENTEGFVDFIPQGASFAAGELFALRVKGESMIGAGILDGDIVIVRRTPVCDNGQIAVALIGDEATLKTFYREDGHFRLQPENPEMEPIITDEVTILGTALSVIRYY